MTESDIGLDISVDIAGFRIDCPVMNGGGTCRTKEEAEELVKSAISIIDFGTITVEQRKENKGETFWQDDKASLNSRGLPNLGMDYYDEYLLEIVEIAHKAGKLLCVSVAGFTPQEYAILAQFAFQKGADIVELNLSCPNVWEGGTQKRIACFDPNLVREILRCVEEVVGQEAKIFVKISPFSDPFALKKIAEVIGQFRTVKAVVSMNTFPNALAFDEKGRPRITVGEGLAGLGGPEIKYIALGQVRQLRNFLPESIDIIGVGGIISGADIVDFQSAGAKAVQICTFLLRFKPQVWPEKITGILIEYTEKLKKRTQPV